MSGRYVISRLKYAYEQIIAASAVPDGKIRQIEAKLIKPSVDISVTLVY